MKEVLTEVWAVTSAVVHVGAAVAVTLDAVLRKRRVSAVIGWVGLAWLARWRPRTGRDEPPGTGIGEATTEPLPSTVAPLTPGTLATCAPTFLTTTSWLRLTASTWIASRRLAERTITTGDRCCAIGRASPTPTSAPR